MTDNQANTETSQSASPTLAKIIDGKTIAENMRDELKEKVDEWVKEGNRRPYLMAVLVGNNEASKRYLQNKLLAATYSGIQSDVMQLPIDTSEADIITLIQKLNGDDDTDGILVQLPLPGHVNERNVCNAVAPEKDVDGFHILNTGKMFLNMDSLVPATALGVVELLNETQIETRGKNVVICGRSKNVGLPIAMLLHSDGKYDLPGNDATVVICHRYTPEEELRYFARRADIIISCAGVVNLIKPDMVKPGACIIDVGINYIRTEDGKSRLVGDVDFEGCRKVAGYITPVPGGVGPMTVAMVLENTFKAAVNIAEARRTTTPEPEAL